jgi:hypothetical protein
VLGSNLAKDLFGNGQAVDQMVRHEPAAAVMGVLASKAAAAGSIDDQAQPISSQQRLFERAHPMATATEWAAYLSAGTVPT